MSGQRYVWHGPSGIALSLDSERDRSAREGAVTGPLTEAVGARQAVVLLRARRAKSGQVVLTHGRAQSAERLAALRLVERELLSGPNFVGMARGVRHWRGAPVRAASGLFVYTLTARGRECWIRVKEQGR